MEALVPKGVFYAFPTLLDGYEAFVFSLLREVDVSRVPGSVFGSSGVWRVRIAFSNSTAQSEEGFDRIEKWI